MNLQTTANCFLTDDGNGLIVRRQFCKVPVSHYSLREWALSRSQPISTYCDCGETATFFSIDDSTFFRRVSVQCWDCKKAELDADIEWVMGGCDE